MTSVGGKTSTYDSQNQLVPMTSSATSVQVAYNGLGERIAKQVSGTITDYLVNELNPTGYPQVVEELNGSGAVTRTYTYGLHRMRRRYKVTVVPGQALQNNFGCC